MLRIRTVALGLVASSFALAAHAAVQPVSPNERPTRVALARDGGALSLPSTASPAAIVAQQLRRQGHDDATLASLRGPQLGRWRDDKLHLRMTQSVGGLRVYDSYVKATMNRRGELLALIENLAPVRGGALLKPTIGETTALGVAFRELGIVGAVPARVSTNGAATTFARDGRFLAQPTVTRVALPMSDRSLAVAFVVETWQRKSNLLDETLVDGGGRVVEVLRRTVSDSYNVYTIDPDTTPQSVEPGVAGWLFGGDHRTIDIAGNNVHAYLDTDNNGAPDAGGTTVSDGNFLSVSDFTVQPSTAVNQNVAAQNLFFLNNVIHDTLYDAGFDEAAGNFQEDNFGLGGRGSDSVNAEAQDGGGTDNANFATPRDGRNPRMQMYLWSSPDPDHEVLVNAPGSIAGSYGARRAAFGGTLDATGITDDVVVADDGTGTTSDGCEAIGNDVSGKIALVDRGTCNFVVKVKNVQDAGAVGAIVANNTGGTTTLVMGGTDATITIPAVMISQNDGATIKSETGVNATMRLIVPAPIMLDGDLDSDIVYHEYGHGLTWRMIGRMDGPMSGAIGEGMSDVLAVVINGDDVVGEYAFSFPGGIRSEPYDAYSRSYGDIVPTEVHLDGEIYGAIGWRLLENYLNDTQSIETLLGDIVDGMNFTTAHPSFEDMRDGILASAAGTGRECLIWDAFAEYGVGVGASGAVRGSRVVITESFDVPASCP